MEHPLRYLPPLLLLLIIGLGGCAVTPTAPLLSPERVQEQSRDGLRVAVSVLSAWESEQRFQLPLYGQGIQPVWLEIENRSGRDYWFAPVSVDPDYFPPLEVAYLNRHGLTAPQQRQLEARLRAKALGLERVAPGERVSGFVFTNKDQGTKIVDLDLLTTGEVRSFTFFVAVPGLRQDHTRVDFPGLYRQDEIHSPDLGGLKTALEQLPCCTLSRSGNNQGDPLNLVLIGHAEDVFHALVQRGWDETETIHVRSLLKSAASFLFGAQYRYSPVSALYLFGRPQDVALQKARSTLHQRNHLRLWLAPLRFDGLPVWVGQISRDIGVKITRRSPTLFTHKIDPDVDEARDYLLQDLAYSQRLARFGYLGGVGANGPDEQRENLTGDPYFTDGRRVVMLITNRPVSLSDIQVIAWEDEAPHRKERK